MEAFLAWLPLLLIIAAVVVMARYQMSSYRKHVDRVEASNGELVTLNREMVAELREIKEVLRERK